MSTTVSSLTSPRSGAPVKNQFIINVDGAETFQSYRTAIARKDGYNCIISSDYNYSVTTSKYFSQWLKTWGFNDSDIKTLRKWLATAKPGDIAKHIVGFANIKYVDSL